MMSEKRFTVMKKFDGSYVICDNGKMLVADDCCDLLNELNNDFEDCEKLLDSKDDFIHKFKRDIEELEISIKLFEDDIATKDKKIVEQQSIINRQSEQHKARLDKLIDENSELRMRIAENDSNNAMILEFISNVRESEMCEGCKHKDKPVEWYLENGLSITAGVCDRYEPED